MEYCVSTIGVTLQKNFVIAQKFGIFRYSAYVLESRKKEAHVAYITCRFNRCNNIPTGVDLEPLSWQLFADSRICYFPFSTTAPIYKTIANSEC